MQARRDGVLFAHLPADRVVRRPKAGIPVLPRVRNLLARNAARRASRFVRKPRTLGRLSLRGSSFFGIQAQNRLSAGEAPRVAAAMLSRDYDREAEPSFERIRSSA